MERGERPGGDLRDQQVRGQHRQHAELGASCSSFCQNPAPGESRPQALACRTNTPSREPGGSPVADCGPLLLPGLSRWGGAQGDCRESVASSEVFGGSAGWMRRLLRAGHVRAGEVHPLIVPFHRYHPWFPASVRQSPGPGQGHPAQRHGPIERRMRSGYARCGIYHRVGRALLPVYPAVAVLEPR
jgi:hypothetical protein